MNARRVVVTGMGVAASLGTRPETLWENLVAGRSGVSAITHFDASSFPVRIGGEVRDLDREALARAFPAAAGEPDHRTWLGLHAAGEAVRDAGLTGDAMAGAFLAVGYSLETFRLDEAVPVLARGGASALLSRAREGVRLQTPPDRLTRLLAEAFGIRGRAATNASACAAGAQTLGEAARRVRCGMVEVALAGAADSPLHPLGLGGFSLLRILSEENEMPERACRPFDSTRAGTVLGEGAGFMILESAGHAQARGTRVYAELLGYGTSLDAYRVSDPEPDGRGAVRAIRRALEDADLSPDAIDAVNAHGTGTPKNDVAEARALRAVFGERRIPVHAVKSQLGHLIAAAGAAEAVVAVLSLVHRRLPPTLNLLSLDPDCDLDVVHGASRPFDGRTVLSNSFGFGGQNAALVFGRHTP